METDPPVICEHGYLNGVTQPTVWTIENESYRLKSEDNEYVNEDNKRENSTSRNDIQIKECDKQNQWSPAEQHDVPFETAVRLTHTGWFHTAISIVSGFTFLSAGLQNNLNAYIIPSAQCDLELTSSEMGLLNAVFLAGGLASGFLWGVLADMIGRKKILVTGMLIDGCLAIMSSFSQEFIVLLSFRFLNGFIVGGPSALILVYMGEFFSETIRSKVLCYAGLLWALSWVIMPALAWVIIPIQWTYETEGLLYNSWRMLVACIGIPSLLSALLLSMFPESPRWLLSQGRMDEARDVLANIYSLNTKCSPDEYIVKSLRSEQQKPDSKDANSNSVWRAISILIHQGQSLFMLPTLKTTALLTTIYFCNMFGYYGLGLWLPELFNRFEAHYAKYPNVSVSVCELSSDLVSNEEVAVCDSTRIDATIFTNSMYIGIALLIGNLISGFLTGAVKRRTMPIFLHVASGLCVLMIYFLSNSTENLIVSAIFQTCIGTANLVLNSLSVDMFPPSISGMGVCLAVLSGRLGAMVSNLVFGHLLDISCAIPILLSAAITTFGGLLSVFIPNEPYSEEKVYKVKQAVVT